MANADTAQRCVDYHRSRITELTSQLEWHQKLLADAERELIWAREQESIDG